MTKRRSTDYRQATRAELAEENRRIEEARRKAQQQPRRIGPANPKAIPRVRAKKGRRS